MAGVEPERMALIISGLALAVAIVAAAFTGSQAREAKRANDRLDTIDRAEERRRRTLEVNNLVRWELVRHGDDKPAYSLRNVGSQSARDVLANATSGIFINGPTLKRSGTSVPNCLRQEVVDVGSAIDFSWTKPSVGGGPIPLELRVTWRGHDEPEIVRL